MRQARKNQFKPLVFKTDYGQVFQFRWENGGFVCDEDFPTELDTFDAVCDMPIGIFDRNNDKGNAFPQVRFRDGVHTLVSFVRGINPANVIANFIDIERLSSLTSLPFSQWHQARENV